MEAWIASHFLNPAFVLGGTALVAAPIIIHLLNRLRYRKVRFAAMEFLLQSQKRNRRRVLIEQLILLLIRILIVLFLMALISRLILDPSELSLFQGTRSHHVVLVDDSGSMQDQLGESTAFEEALDVVKKLVAEGANRPGTQKFTMLLLSRPDQPIFTQQEVDQQFQVELDSRLERMKCSHQSLELSQGLEGARNVLVEDRASVRHLHIISDFRNDDWEDQKALTEIIAELDTAEVAINLVKTVGQRNQNLGLTKLTGDVQVASVEVPVRLTVGVKNYGDQLAKSVSLGIFQNGQKLPLAVNFDRIEPGAEVDQKFDLTFSTPGRHRIDVTLAADPLAADNSRFLAVDIVPVNKVLVVEGNPANDEGDYIQDALAASPTLTGYSVQLETVDYLRRRPLDEFQSIFLLNVSSLPPDALAPLESFAREGGGVAWFLGDEIKPSFYISELYRAGVGLFPVKLGLISEVTQEREAESGPDTVFAEHPMFGVFQGQDNPFTGVMTVHEYFPVSEDWESDDQKREDGVRTIARLYDKTPLIFEKKFGAGTVIAALTSGGPRWNNWAAQPSFVPMMLDQEKYIAKRDRVLERRVVGEPIRLSLNPVEFLEDIEIVAPETSSTPLTRLKAAPTSDKPEPSTEEKPEGEEGEAAEEKPASEIRLAATFNDTDAPGIYVVKLLDQNNAPVEKWITYNVPTDESDLNLAKTEDIREQLGDDLTIQIQEPGEFSWIAGKEAGQEVRNWILIGLIIFFLAEQMLGCRLSYHSRSGGAA